jgi:hypothetical protein
MPGPAEPTAASLSAALAASTGQPPIRVPALSLTPLPSAFDAALRAIVGHAEQPAPAPPEPDLASQLATTRRLIAEIEVELERLRAEASELERQLAEQRLAAGQATETVPANEAVVESTPGRTFAAIFRRGDPARAPRQYRGYVEVTVETPASPDAVREVERLLAALPDTSIRLVWGIPRRGTTIGLELRQPLALGERLKAAPFVASVRELGDRDGVGRLHVRVREP